MEDKTIKVKCINTLNFKDLTLGEEYTVIEEEPQGYKIMNDAESIRRYNKSQFAKVEDTLIVECIDNKDFEDRLTLNKEYPIIDIDEDYYVIKDDQGKKQNFYIARFKPIEPQYPINHVPNYAEEQLEHAEQQEEKLVEILKKELEETKKTSASNYDDYREHLKTLKRELEDTKKEYLKKYQKETEEHIKERKSLKEENKKLKDENIKYKNLAENLKGDIDRYIKIANEAENMMQENKKKLYNYESIKGLIKILYEGL